MQNTLILDQLTEIRDRYLEVLDLTTGMSTEVEPELMEVSVEQRKTLLFRIEYLQKRLAGTSPDWNEKIRNSTSGQQLSREIQSIIRSVLSQDTSLRQKLQSRMKSVRSELAGMSRSSKAALSYAAHGWQ